MIKVIYRYPYLNLIIDLWTLYWKEKLLNMYEVIREHIRHQK